MAPEKGLQLREESPLTLLQYSQTNILDVNYAHNSVFGNSFRDYKHSLIKEPSCGRKVFPFPSLFLLFVVGSLSVVQAGCPGTCWVACDGPELAATCLPKLPGH